MVTLNWPISGSVPLTVELGTMHVSVWSSPRRCSGRGLVSHLPHCKNLKLDEAQEAGPSKAAPPPRQPHGEMPRDVVAMKDFERVHAMQRFMSQQLKDAPRD